MLPSLVRFLRLLLVVVATTLVASAMSVQPPSFPELVAEAETVVRARVIDVSSRFVEARDGTRQIRTFVTFATLKPLKGAPAGTVTLSFLGGTVDGESWTIAGMPQFKVGDEEFVFATAGQSICPLVGAMYGRYRVVQDPQSARTYVARDNRTPLRSTAEVGAPMHDAVGTLSTTSAVTPEQFEQLILSEVAQPASRAPQQ